MKLNFKKLGNGSQNLVVLHGFLGTLDNWITLGRRWAEDFSVYLVDLRNHGFSPHSEEFNYPAMAGDVLDLLREEGIKSPIILGHSMGGKVAMYLALQHPEMLEALVVVDIAPRGISTSHDALVDALCRLDLQHLSSRKEADEALARDIPSFGIRQFLLKNLDRKGDGFVWKMNLPVLREKIAEIGAEIQAEQPFQKPTIFIAGSNSDYIIPSDEADIKKKFTRARIVHVHDAGHWVHAEKPDEVYEIVKTFAELIG
jgi:pimeloyl-ACP methyl ester carboxylesterase